MRVSTSSCPTSASSRAVDGDPRPDAAPLVAWASRHWITTWAIAWGVAGVAFFTADIFSRPRKGPLWVVVFGLLAWSAAGSMTLHRAHRVRGALVWALTYLLACWLGALWGAWFDSNGSAGFLGALLGWVLGGSIGAMVSASLSAPRRGRVGPVIVAAAWGLGFLVGGYVAIVAGMLLAQVAKDTFGFLGQRTPLSIGWGLGAAVGGALASALGMAARDGVTGPSSDEAI